jgi:hypothetical protein
MAERADTVSILSLRLAVPLGLATLALMSCRGTTVVASPRPKSSAVVTVTMREYSFSVSHPLPGGRVVFRVRNAGHETHSLLLVPLEDSDPAIAEAVHRLEPPFRPLGEINPREPGSTGVFAVNLEPGRRYAMICNLDSGDGVSHAFKGMAWEGRAARHHAAGSR